MSSTLATPGSVFVDLFDRAARPVPKKPPPANPLLVARGMPSFKAIRPEHVVPAAKALIEDELRTIERVLAGGRFDWKNFAEPLIEIDARRDRIIHTVAYMATLMKTKALCAASDKAESLVEIHEMRKFHNRALHEAYRVLSEDRSLTARQREYAKSVLTYGEFVGVNLEPVDQERLAQISGRLTELECQFGRNADEALSTVEHVVTSRAKLEGLPESIIEEAKKGPRTYRLAMDESTCGWVLCFAENRELRRIFFEAGRARGTSAPHDNRPVFEEILKLRAEAAKLRGHRHWMDSAPIVPRMASSVEEISSFLDELNRRVKPLVAKELEELQAFAIANGATEPLEPWDIDFWSTKLREKVSSSADLSPYLEESRVLEGVFEIVRRVFGVRIVPKAAETWHPGVQHYEVIGGDGNKKGSLYFDLHVRNRKMAGPRMIDPARRIRTTRSFEFPSAAVICDLEPVKKGEPSFLSHPEVVLLFHELGHALHSVLTNVDIPRIGGTHVARDFLEFPSQFFENYAWEKEALKLFARHHETGEPLPDDQIEALIASRTFQAGLDAAFQIALSRYDLRIHSMAEPLDARSIQACFDQAVAETGRPSSVHGPFAFDHLASLGCAANYYAYDWSGVLAADAFERFREEGIFNRQTGRELVRHVFGLGASRPPAELFRRFRGRDPNPDALFARLGVA